MSSESLNISYLDFQFYEGEYDCIYNKFDDQNFEIKEINKLMNNLKKYHLATFQHSLNVAKLSSILAREMGMEQKDIFCVSIGGLLHDYGKIKISPAILDKTNKLNDIEWTNIKKHTEYGMKLLSKYIWIDLIKDMILYHHERIDGCGYYGLTGKDIPQGARIISIADAFDAMYHKRPYRSILTLSQCWDELENNKNTQFDSELVDIFIYVTKKISLEKMNTFF